MVESRQYRTQRYCNTGELNIAVIMSIAIASQHRKLQNLHGMERFFF